MSRQKRRKFNFNLGEVQLGEFGLEDFRSMEGYVSERWSWNKKSLYVLFNNHAVVYHMSSDKYFVTDLKVIEWIDRDRLSFYGNGNGYWKADIPRSRLLEGYEGKKIYIHAYVLFKNRIDFSNKEIHHINIYNADNRFKNLIALEKKIHDRAHEVAEMCEREYKKFIQILRNKYRFEEVVDVTVVKLANGEFYALLNFDYESDSLKFKDRDELNLFINRIVTENDLDEYELNITYVKSSYLREM